MAIQNATILPTFPRLPQAIYEIELAGTTCTARLTWRPRLASWYIDLFDAAGEPIALGYRVTPESVWRKLEPDGYFTALGNDPYLQFDLGTTLLPFFLEF